MGCCGLLEGGDSGGYLLSIGGDLLLYRGYFPLYLGMISSNLVHNLFINTYPSIPLLLNPPTEQLPNLLNPAPNPHNLPININPQPIKLRNQHPRPQLLIQRLDLPLQSHLIVLVQPHVLAQGGQYALLRVELGFGLGEFYEEFLVVLDALAVFEGYLLVGLG